MGRNVEAVVPNLPDDSQIHAFNLKGSANKDLPYIVYRWDA